MIIINCAGGSWNVSAYIINGSPQTDVQVGKDKRSGLVVSRISPEVGTEV